MNRSIMQRHRRRRFNWRRYAGWSLMAVSALWLGGFVWFSGRLALYEPAIHQRPVDGIVVLTGGAGRIGAGLDLMASGMGERLLISGVNLDVDRATLEREYGEARTRLFECCVDIGRVALDTRGNAAEAADWTRQRGFGSLLIVTARNHMPRSLLEFRQLLPGVRLQPHGVRARPGLGEQLREYSKYLVRLLDIRLF